MRGIPYRLGPSSGEARANADQLNARERLLKARILSTGPSGGEVLVEAATTIANPFQDLRAGQWVMLCGPKPIMATLPTPADAEFAAAWYQVQAVDEDALGLTANQRLISLRGPEWMWSPAANVNDNSHLSNNLCVGVFPGAVAVHTKTMRLASAPQ
jgi:hypothetical protein